jgi:hypothetical protein
MVSEVFHCQGSRVTCQSCPAEDKPPRVQLVPLIAYMVAHETRTCLEASQYASFFPRLVRT